MPLGSGGVTAVHAMGRPASAGGEQRLCVAPGMLEARRPQSAMMDRGRRLPTTTPATEAVPPSPLEVHLTSRADSAWELWTQRQEQRRMERARQDSRAKARGSGNDKMV